MSRIVFQPTEVNDEYFYLVWKDMENPYCKVKIPLGIISERKDRHEFADNGEGNSYDAEDMRAILNKLDELNGVRND